MDILLYCRLGSFVKLIDCSVHSDVQTAQRGIKDSMAAFASTSGDEVSLTNVNKSHTAGKVDLKRVLAASGKVSRRGSS